MAFGMQPLTLELISEGDYLEEYEAAIEEAQQVLAEYREKHGDASHKATVVVEAKIKFQIMNPAEGTTAIKTQVDVKRPAPPAQITTAIESVSEDGDKVLFVKAGGSDSGDPTQTKFATKHGDMVGDMAESDEES